jgi:hypothetical protein
MRTSLAYQAAYVTGIYLTFTDSTVDLSFLSHYKNVFCDLNTVSTNST